MLYHLSPITAKIIMLSYLSILIHVIQCVCGLVLSVTIPCLEARVIRTQVVANKTTLKSVFDTIYFNQIYTDLVILVYKSFGILTGQQCDLKHAHDIIIMHMLLSRGLCPLHVFIPSYSWYPPTLMLNVEAHFPKNKTSLICNRNRTWDLFLPTPVSFTDLPRRSRLGL